MNELENLREVATGRQLTMEEFEMTVGHSPIVQELMRRRRRWGGFRIWWLVRVCGGGVGYETERGRAIARDWAREGRESKRK